jgi:hypothetical protein
MILKQQMYIAALLLFCVSCSQCGGVSKADKAITEACKDGLISDDDIATIATALRENKREAAKYRDDAAVLDYIKKHNGCLGSDNLTTTTTSTPSVNDSLKPVYNVFIENSMSMDGYVRGNTDFKNAIYGFLSDILLKTNGIADSMHLFYINSKLIPFKDDVTDFIEKLNPSSFSERGGERGTSDIHGVLKTALDATSKGQVAVFVSDCVFSPGRGKDADDYLVNQSIGIKSTFSNFIYANPELATVVIKLNSEFDGTYYDLYNSPHTLKARRPYYIWLIGKYDHIKKLRDKIELKKLRAGFEDFYAFYPLSIAASPSYRILKNSKIGSFEPDREKPQSNIINAKAESRDQNAGKFRFAVGIDLAKLGLAESFLTNVANYKLSSDKYTLTVEAISEKEQQTDPSLSKLSHKLLVTTSDLQPTELDISLIRKIPQWIDDSNSKNDVTQAGEELKRTYGFRSLVQGVSDAYVSLAKEQADYFKIHISIKK